MKNLFVLLFVIGIVTLTGCEKENNYYFYDSNSNPPTTVIPNGLNSGDSYSEIYTDYTSRGLGQEWSFKEIVVPKNLIVEGVICSFNRPGFPTCLQDLRITWNNVDLYNYDNECQMYNTFLYVGKEGNGILKISVPTTHGVIWNKIEVFYKLK